jgi:MoxR-like ATPase
VRKVHVAAPLFDYVQAIVAHTRQAPDFVSGLSPRSGLNLLHAARAWAFIEGRGFVIPEDVQSVLPGVAAHRLQWSSTRRPADSEEAGQRLLAQVPVP